MISHYNFPGKRLDNFSESSSDGISLFAFKNLLGPSFQAVARIIFISGTLAQVLLIKIIKGMRIL